MKKIICCSLILLLLVLSGCNRPIMFQELPEQESEQTKNSLPDTDAEITVDLNEGQNSNEQALPDQLPKESESFPIEIIEKDTSNFSTEEDLSSVEIAREKVVEKWRTASNEFGTTKYIEDIYKAHPNDSVISNIYFYCIASEQYEYYKSLGKSNYLSQAIEYAEKIDPNYSGEFSSEIRAFVDTVIPSGVTKESHTVAKQKTDKYSSLTNSEKKQICAYIESRYEYYDNLNGGYSGDKYSDTIMLEAAQKYGLTTTQIKTIWTNMYSY